MLRYPLVHVLEATCLPPVPSLASTRDTADLYHAHVHLLCALSTTLHICLLSPPDRVVVISWKETRYHHLVQIFRGVMHGRLESAQVRWVVQVYLWIWRDLGEL